MKRLGWLRRVVRLFYDNGLALVLLLIFSFVMLRLLPGDQVDVLLNTGVNNEISQARHDQLVAGLGLNQPLVMQFFHWLEAVSRGNLSYSYVHSASVASVIFNAVPWTMSLVLLAVPLSLVAGSLSGLITGMLTERMSGWIFATVTLLSSLPGFVIGLLLFRILGFYLNWFPTDGGGMSLEARITGAVSLPDVVWHGVLPLIALSFHGCIRYFYLAYGLARQIRCRPFIAYARMRGVKGFRLLWHWYLPNALPEIVSRLSSSLPGMVSTTIFIEVIFSYPGAGSLMLDAITHRDYALVQGCLLVVGSVVLLCNTLLDMLSAILARRG